jgi:hypothetical protein
LLQIKPKLTKLELCGINTNMIVAYTRSKYYLRQETPPSSQINNAQLLLLELKQIQNTLEIYLWNTDAKYKSDITKESILINSLIAAIENIRSLLKLGKGSKKLHDSALFLLQNAYHNNAIPTLKPTFECLYRELKYIEIQRIEA